MRSKWTHGVISVSVHQHAGKGCTGARGGADLVFGFQVEFGFVEEKVRGLITRFESWTLFFFGKAMPRSLGLRSDNGNRHRRRRRGKRRTDSRLAK